MKIQEINNAIALALKLTGYVNEVLVGYLDIPQASFTAPQVLLTYTGIYQPGNTVVLTATSDQLSDMTILIDGEIVALLHNALVLIYSYTIPADAVFTNISASATNSVGLSDDVYLNLEALETYAVQSISSQLPNYNPAFQEYLYETEGIAENLYFTTQEEAAAVTAFTNSFTAEQIPELTHLDELRNFTSLTTIPLMWAISLDMQTYTITGATNLESIVFPNSLTTIGTGAFAASGLVSVVIPDSVTSIDSGVFAQCVSLTSAYIGSGITSIPRDLFGSCESLTTIEVSPDNSVYDSRDNCNAIIKTATNSLEIGFLSTVIPSTVTTIEELAFTDCISLLNITIPNTVTTIGREAFRNTGLTSITLPNSITTWNGFVFMNCTSLRSASFESGVTKVPNGYFERCTSLMQVTIPDSVTSIEYGAFHSCSGLTSITIPNSVTTIEWVAFYECTGLTSIEIPNSVTSIEQSAFKGCTGLTSITVLATTPPTIVTGASNGTFTNVDTTIPVYVPAESVTAYQNSSWGLVFSNIQSGTAYAVLSFDSSLPNYNPELQEALYSGGIVSTQDRTTMAEAASVTSIGNALRYNAFLTSADELQYFGLTSIAANLFEECYSLTSIIIPNGVTSIGDHAFEYCTRLTSVTIPNSVSSIGYATFNNCRSLTSLTIPSSMTSIGSHAFAGCNLTSIEIPNSVTSIGEGAFYYCEALTSISIPNSVTSIGALAFYNCTGLTSVTIGNGVTSIGEIAFSGTGLAAVTVLATTPPTLGGSAFSNSPITEIRVPAGSVSAYQNAAGWSSYNIVPIS